MRTLKAFIGKNLAHVKGKPVTDGIGGQEIGRITDYDPKTGSAMMEINGDALKVGLSISCVRSQEILS